jgi:hypothetical protein
VFHKISKVISNNLKALTLTDTVFSWCWKYRQITHFLRERKKGRVDKWIKYGLKEFVSQEFNISWICHISTTQRFHFEGGKEIISMQYSPFWKEDSLSAVYKIPIFYGNRSFTAMFISARSWDLYSTNSLRSISALSFHLRVLLWSGLLPFFWVLQLQ